MLGILTKINWVDILIVILLVRISYIATKRGFPIEFFKTAGIISAVYLSLHYYSRLALFVQHRSKLDKLNPDIFNFLSFLILALLGYCIFMLLRKIFLIFIKIEAVDNLNRWGGMFLGVLRSLLLSSLVIYGLLICGVSYFKKSALESYSGKYVYRVAPYTYKFLWDSFFSRFSRGGTLNNDIFYATSETKESKK